MYMLNIWTVVDINHKPFYTCSIYNTTFKYNLYKVHYRYASQFVNCLCLQLAIEIYVYTCMFRNCKLKTLSFNHI